MELLAMKKETRVPGLFEPNHFSPTPDEVDRIKAENKLLPQLEKTCYKCGHKPCEYCDDWCDYIMYDITWSGNWEGLDQENIDENGQVWPPHVCCDMYCSYE